MENPDFYDLFRYPAGMPGTLQELIQEAFQKYSSNSLIYSDQEGSVFRYMDAEAITYAIAEKLRSHGISRGDFVCSYSAVHPESVLLFWACAMMGIIFVPLDHSWPFLLLEKVIRRVKPSLIFCDMIRATELSKENIPTPTIVYDSLNKESGNSVGLTFSEWIIDTDPNIDILPDITHLDTAVILFTSGTTSEPKGVMLSQGALTRSGWLMKKAFGFEAQDIQFSIGELNAMSGLRNPCVATLHAGSSFVIASSEKRSNILAISELIRDYKCTIVSTAPAVVRQLIQFRERLPGMAFRSLKHIVSTGSELKEDLIREFQDQFKIKLINYYGLTETCGLCIGMTVFHKNSGYEDTIGVPIGAIAEVVDEQNKPVKQGEAGELRIKSPNLMNGYFQDEELTATILKDGWFYTGDLAIIRMDHHISLIGRKTDIIKDVHANLIHPGEIESILETHPLVKEAGVCGYIAEGGEERIAAFIVPEDPVINETEYFKGLNNWIEKNQGERKRASKFIIKKSLPKSGNNKLLRRKLSDELENG